MSVLVSFLLWVLCLVLDLGSWSSLVRFVPGAYEFVSSNLTDPTIS